MPEYEVGDETIEISPPDYMVEAAEAAQDAQEDGLVPGECGTGVGDRRADQISNDETGPDVVIEIASYLTSHEEDVTAEGHPRSWTEEEWDDCGNAQAAKWGDSGDERSKEWAQRKANQVAEARDEEIPYPELNDIMTESHDSKDFQFETGDFVSWEFGDGESQGEITERTDEEGDSMSAGGNEFTVDDEENPLYKIQEWDEDEGEEGEFTNLVVKFEESLSSATRPEEAPDSAPQNRNTRELNQLSQEELREISEKAGTEDAPKVHKHFQLNSKDIKQGEDEDGNPIYKVPISGDARDRDRDKMTLEAQEEMTEQLRTGKIPVYGDHGRASDAPRYSFTNILGQFINGELSAIDNQERNEGEKVTLADMRLRTSHTDAKELQELLEGDWPVGFSVGFIPTEVEEITNDDGELTGLKVLDLDLMEASAVGIPSQPDSVPVGISQNSTQAAVAMKSVLDESGKEVDIDDLEKSLKNVIGDESMEQNENEEAGDSPDDTNSSFVEENRDSFKTLIKESLRDLKAEDLEKRMEKAPENVSEGDIQSFFADHFDDMDMSDVEGAVDQADAEYIGQLDLSAYAKVLATAYDAGEDEVMNIMEEIIDQLEEMEDGEDGEENDSDPDEEDDQDPDEEDDGEPDEEDEEDEDEDDEEEMDEENMTDPDKSTGPDGSGPIQRAGDGDDEKDDVELSDDLDEDEIEDLSFGGRP